MSEEKQPILLSEEHIRIIVRAIRNLVEFLGKELKISEVDMLIYVWDCTNLDLRMLDKDHPEFEIQKIMNRYNISCSKFLNH